MKSITTKQIARSLAGLGMVVLGSSAFAATSWTQDLTTALPSGTTVSGWSTGSAAGTAFAAAPLINYGSAGLGVDNANDAGVNGAHATDNVNGIDAMLISFSTAANLSGLTLGWNASDTNVSNSSGTYNDSDVSVLVWTGASAAPTATSGTLATMLTSGWTLIGNYANVGQLAANTQAISTSIYSSYWLISAYSTAYGTTNSGVTGSALGEGNDSFKVLSIAGNTCTGTVTNNACGSTTTNVPEPGSLALIGAAMAGFVATRRRKSKAV